MGKLGSFLTKKPLQSNDNQLKIYPILNSTFLVTHKNQLLFYKYKIGTEKSELIIEEPQIIQLTYNVNEIVSCDPKFVQDRGEVPIIFTTNTGLALFIYDSKEMLLR